MLESPYTASFGARPEVVAGRDVHVRRVESELSQVLSTQRRARVVPVFTGVRGVGKTVLLGLAKSVAEERGFAAVKLTLGSSQPLVDQVVTSFGEDLEEVGAQAPKARRFWERLGKVSVGVNLGVLQVGLDRTAVPEPVPTVVTGRTFAAMLEDATAAVVESGSAGLVLLLDEIQEPEAKDLELLNSAMQTILENEAAGPFMMVAAGLPAAPDRLTAASSFAERYEYQTVDLLTESEATLALVAPAAQVGVRWMPEAKDLVLEAAGGSPYLLQLYGDKTWREAAPAGRGDVITAEHARAGVAEGFAQLTSGMFRARWNKATAAQQDLLTAIAQVEGTDGLASTADVTLALGESRSSSWTRARAELIDKGLIASVRRGIVSFTMPGFGHFVLNQTGQEKHGLEHLEALQAVSDAMPGRGYGAGRPAADSLGEAPRLRGGVGRGKSEELGR